MDKDNQKIREPLVTISTKIPRKYCELADEKAFDEGVSRSTILREALMKGLTRVERNRDSMAAETLMILRKFVAAQDEELYDEVRELTPKLMEKINE